jgi:hypothetical protein
MSNLNPKIKVEAENEFQAHMNVVSHNRDVQLAFLQQALAAATRAEKKVKNLHAILSKNTTTALMACGISPAWTPPQGSPRVMASLQQPRVGPSSTPNVRIPSSSTRNLNAIGYLVHASIVEELTCGPRKVTSSASKLLQTLASSLHSNSVQLIIWNITKLSASRKVSGTAEKLYGIDCMESFG